MNDRIRIGKRIAELRKEAGLTQVQLAEKSGVGFSHIARIEIGRYSVGVDTLEKIGNALGVKLDFVSQNNHETPKQHHQTN